MLKRGYMFMILGGSLLLGSSIIDKAFGRIDPGFANVTTPVCNDSSCFANVFQIQSVPSLPSLEFLPPDWFQPTDLESASEDPWYWINEVLPFEQHRFEDTYLVIPTMGLVVPVVEVPKGSADFNTLAAGKTININDYLRNGVMHFPQTANPGEQGNMFIFGHSNGLASWPGEFNSVLAKGMGLEVNVDQVWVFQKENGGEFDLYKYDVVASYNTTPQNVNVMLWDGEGADITLSMCTDILGGRWIVKASLVDEWADVPPAKRNAINSAILKIHRLPEPERSEVIDFFFSKLEDLKAQGLVPQGQEIVVEYILMLLAELF